MDTFWLKVAAVIVVIFGVIIGVNMLMPDKQDEPKEPPKTIYDMAEKDRKELLAAPSAKDFGDSEKPEQQSESAEGTEQQDGQTAPVVVEPEKPAEPTVLYFKEVSEIENIEADRILQMIPSWRTIGRMPFTGYNAMVESCRLLMERWPGSRYDYMARRALSEVPQRFWGRYQITDKEIDLEYFKKQRPDTIQYTVTEDD